MLTYVQGSLFESPAKVLVNTVNTVGVMGKGIALEFKNVYPEMFKRYQQLCEQKLMLVGSLWLFKTSHKWILNFPTKEHWLPYLLRVQLTTSSVRGLGASENGLRLYAPHDQRAQPTFQASLQPA